MSADGEATTSPLVEVCCRGCRDAYAVLAAHAPRGTACFRAKVGGHEVLDFLCRRCRLVKFAEELEWLLEAGPAGLGLSPDGDPAEYALTFFGAVDELYEISMQKEF